MITLEELKHDEELIEIWCKDANFFVNTATNGMEAKFNAMQEQVNKTVGLVMKQNQILRKLATDLLETLNRIEHG